MSPLRGFEKESILSLHRSRSYGAKNTITPGMMGGQACVRGMRIPVSLVVNLVANGMERVAIIEEYPDLEPEDIIQALQYAAC